MNIYLIEQSKNLGYDTYDSAVVVARSVKDARSIHPRLDWFRRNGMKEWNGKDDDSWVDAKYVIVTYIGKASPKMDRSVVCASFHAG